MRAMLRNISFLHIISRRLHLSGALALAGIACLAPPAAEAQTTTRTVVVARTASSNFAAPGWATLDLRGRNHGAITTVTTVRQVIETENAPRFAWLGTTPVDQLPVVVGIRPTPVAPPTVYRIEGPSTAMHKADEERMRQVNPGARVITPLDLSVSPQMRRRYAIPQDGVPREMRRRRVAESQGVMMPQVIIVRPSGTY
jgi:hypothetical protein